MSGVAAAGEVHKQAVRNAGPRSEIAVPVARIQQVIGGQRLGTAQRGRALQQLGGGGRVSGHRRDAGLVVALLVPTGVRVRFVGNQS